MYTVAMDTTPKPPLTRNSRNNYSKTSCSFWQWRVEPGEQTDKDVLGVTVVFEFSTNILEISRVFNMAPAHYRF